jgi:hypothetical protein
MSKNRFLQILFSLAVIAALTFAIAPAPVYALSSSTSTAAISGSAVWQANTPAFSPNALVYRAVVARHNGHRIQILRCHQVIRTI